MGLRGRSLVVRRRLSQICQALPGCAMPFFWSRLKSQLSAQVVQTCRQHFRDSRPGPAALSMWELRRSWVVKQRLREK
jgi:hypothetical protein